MKIPTIKDKYRYRLIGRPNQVDFAVYDTKTDQKVTKYLLREEAEARKKQLTKLAISKEEKHVLKEKKHRREIRLGYG